MGLSHLSLPVGIVRHWCAWQDVNLHSFELDSKSSRSANSPTSAYLAESVGFEPTVAFTTSDFKSGAINQTLPTLQKLFINLILS